MKKIKSMKDFTISKSITDRSNSCLKIYMSEVSKYKLLTLEEEAELARRIRRNDKKALEKLVNSNLRYVISVAKTYQNCGLDLMDIINAGNIGLMKAAEKFDERKGFKFISFASYWIRQEIMDELNKYGRTVRLPANIINEKNKIKHAANMFAQKYDRQPSNSELAAMLNISEYVIEHTLNEIVVVSIDKVIDEESGYCIADTLSDDFNPYEDYYTTHDRETIDWLISSLDDQTREIIKYTYGYDSEELTVKEIADIMGISKQKVYQTIYKAQKKMRALAGCNDPRF